MKDRLRRVYKSVWHKLPFSDRAPLFKNLLLHEKYPVAYVRVPKAGCSTIIARMLGNEVVAFDGSLRLHSKNSLITFDDMAFVERISSMGQNARLFTVVRDPFSRLLSGFREKIESQLDGPRYRVEFGIGVDEPINFADFVSRLVDCDPLVLDVHFQPQALITRADVLSYDHVFRLENMCDALDWLDCVLPETESSDAFVAPHATFASTAVATAYDAGTARKVADYYAKDFALFNYPTDPGGVVLSDAIETAGMIALSQFSMGTMLALDNRMRSFLPGLLVRH